MEIRIDIEVRREGSYERHTQRRMRCSAMLCRMYKYDTHHLCNLGKRMDNRNDWEGTIELPTIEEGGVFLGLQAKALMDASG